MIARIAETQFFTLSDLAKQFGPLPANRIRWSPLPGLATERDVVEIYEQEKRLCELVDGVLVEKTMGLRESFWAMALGHLLNRFLEEHPLGFVAGADGMMRLAPGLVRISDVSFVSWKSVPGAEVPSEPLPDLVPDLAVEVLSEGNTKEEMDRKLKDFFRTGVRLVWFIDPKTRSVRVYQSPKKSKLVGPKDTLKGGKVLPGFSPPWSEFLRWVDRQSRA